MIAESGPVAAFAADGFSMVAVNSPGAFMASLPRFQSRPLSYKRMNSRNDSRIRRRPKPRLPRGLWHTASLVIVEHVPNLR